MPETSCLGRKDQYREFSVLEAEVQIARYLDEGSIADDKAGTQESWCWELAKKVRESDPNLGFYVGSHVTVTSFPGILLLVPPHSQRLKDLPPSITFYRFLYLPVTSWVSSL